MHIVIVVTSVVRAFFDWGFFSFLAVGLPEVYYHFSLDFTYLFRIWFCSKHLQSTFWVFRQFVNPVWGSPPLHKNVFVDFKIVKFPRPRKGSSFFLKNLTAAAGAFALAFAVERKGNICNSALSAESFFVLFLFIKCTSAGSYFFCSAS